MEALVRLYYEISKYKIIYIYGAGIIGRRLNKWLQQNIIETSGFIVSKKEDAKYEDRVFFIGDILDLSECTVILAMKEDYIKDVCSTILVDYRIGNTVLLTDEQREALSFIEGYEQKFKCQSEKYLIDCHSIFLEKYMAVISRKTDGKRIFRAFVGYIGDMSPILNKCTEEQFLKEFYDIIFFQHSGSTDKENLFYESTGVEIYVATSHLDCMDASNDSSSWIPLQVGAALTSIRKGCSADDTGDQISGKNKDYSECTGLYWIWKNTSGQDYVGICHYRRKLYITYSDIECIRKCKVDAIVAYPQFVGKRIKDFFMGGNHVTKTDWDIMRTEIIKIDDAYEDVINQYDGSFFYFSCNLALMKRTLFDEYCDFAFRVAAGIEGYYKAHGIIREDRYMGYIFENLLTIFLMRNQERLKIAATDVIWEY